MTPILIPTHLASNEVDYECELAVVIGRECKNVSRDRALDYVLGYTCANDVSARDWQIKTRRGTVVPRQVFRYLLPTWTEPGDPDEITNPNALKIATRLNGQTVQDWTTSDMIFDVPTLIEFLSGSTTLVAGTVILTGTPHGVGMANKPNPRWLKPGDEVTIEIEKIGQLTNPVALEPANRRAANGEQPPWRGSQRWRCSTPFARNWARGRVGMRPGSRLWWIDILGQKYFEAKITDASPRVLTSAQMIGAVAPTESGGLIAALRDGIYLVDPETGVSTPFARAPGHDEKQFRFNDAKVDPRGRFWAGTLALDGRRGTGAPVSSEWRRFGMNMRGRGECFQRTRLGPGRTDDVLYRFAHPNGPGVRLRSGERHDQLAPAGDYADREQTAGPMVVAWMWKGACGWLTGEEAKYPGGIRVSGSCWTR